MCVKHCSGCMTSFKKRLLNHLQIESTLFRLRANRYLNAPERPAAKKEPSTTKYRQQHTSTGVNTAKVAFPPEISCARDKPKIITTIAQTSIAKPPMYGTMAKNIPGTRTEKYPKETTRNVVSNPWR